MSRFLVLTGTTGFALLELGVLSLPQGAHTFLLQTKNDLPLSRSDSVSHVRHIDMDKIDLSEVDGVIGHCGAGTVFWALERAVPFLAVVDLSRPDGHQRDLGSWLAANNYAMVLENRAPNSDHLDELLRTRFEKYGCDAFQVEKVFGYLS